MREGAEHTGHNAIRTDGRRALSGRLLAALTVSAVLLCTVWPSEGRALEGNVESVESLKDLTGLWAHSEADCKTELSGALKHADRATGASYEFVGICADGVDMLYQPVNCGASDIVKQGDLIEFSAACRIKDYVAKKRQRVLLKVENADRIMFADPKFMIFGRYQRCNRAYTCEKSWNK